MFGNLFPWLERDASSRMNAELTREQTDALGTIAEGGYGYVDDGIGKRLVRLGLCERQWHEGLGAGFYRYEITEAGREALR